MGDVPGVDMRRLTFARLGLLDSVRAMTIKRRKIGFERVFVET